MPRQYTPDATVPSAPAPRKRPKRAAKRGDAAVAALREGFAHGRTLLGYDLAATDARDRADGPVWLDNPEAHSLCIAPTGAGKGRASLMPQLLSWPGAAIVIDPKGEAAHVTARYRREALGQRVVYLDPFGVVGAGAPDTLNPFDARRVTGDRIQDFALGVPEMIHPGHAGSLRDRFWDTTGDQLISAVACGVLAVEPPERRHLGTVAELLLGDDVQYALALYLDQHGDALPPLARRGIASHIGTVEQTRGGVLATAQQHLRLFTTEAVAAAFAKTSFDLDDLRGGAPMTVYLVLPPAKLRSHSKVLRIWLTALLRVVMSRTEIPALPTAFFVDELAQLGSISDIELAFTLLRGYGLRISAYLQDLQQLKRLYPDSWETILGNAGCLQLFRPNTRIAAQRLSRLFPKSVKPDHVLSLARDEQLLLFAGGRHAAARKLDYLGDAVFAGRYEANPYYRQSASAAP